MPNIQDDLTTARAWATRHVAAAFAIGVALGFVLKMVF